MALFQLGPLTFQLRGLAPHNLTRADSWRWEATPRLSGEVALQYLGRGEGEVTLEATLYPKFMRGHSESAVEIIRATASAGAPLPLIRGDLKMIGWYAIGSVEEDHTYMDHMGRPRRDGVVLTLLRFGADGPGTGLMSFMR